MISDLVHQYYADDRIVEHNMDGVRAYMDMNEALLTNASNTHGYENMPGVLAQELYGDWAGLYGDPRTHGADLGTFYFVSDAEIAARWAALLGNASEAARFTRMAQAARSAYDQFFFDNASIAYTDPVYYGAKNFFPISQMLPLALGLEQAQANGAAVLENLLQSIYSGGHTGYPNASSWGIVGNRYFWPL
jgi:hypothetical protein